MYEGDEFMIEVRYAQFLSAFLVTMMFSTGMPGLYPVMLLKLFLIYKNVENLKIKVIVMKKIH